MNPSLLTPRPGLRTLSFLAQRILVATVLAGALSACSKKDNQTQFLELAKRHFETGEFEKAKAEFSKVLEKSPGNQAAIAGIGLIWMEQGAPLRAIPYLMEMRKLAPNDTSLRLKLLAALNALQDAGEVMKEATAILNIEPGNETALLYLSSAIRTPEDMETVRKRLAGYPSKDSAAFHAAAAPLFLRSRDIPSAEASLKKAIDLDPRSVPSHLALARLHDARMNQTAAEREFKIASELAPLRSPERLQYAEFKLKNGAPAEAAALAAAITAQAPDYLPALLLSARAAIDEKNYSAAQTFAQQIISLDNDNFEARLVQAQALIEETKVKPAIDILEKLLATYPGHPVIQFRLASAYLKDGNSNKAISLLTSVVAASPDSVEPALMLAAVKITKGQSEEVVTEMRALLKKQPGLVGAMRMLATACQATNKLDEASALLENLVKEAPKNIQFLYQLGCIQRQAGKKPEAIKSFESILKESPTDLAAMSNLVDMDLQEKNFDSALKRVEPLLVPPPGRLEGHVSRGKIFIAQEKWDDAEAALLKAIAIKADDEPSYQLLMQVYVKAGKLNPAMERASQLLAKQPDNRQALLMAGLISEQLKDYAGARKHYEKLLTLNPNMPVVMNNLAASLGNHLNEPDKAFALATEARKLRPRQEPNAPANTRLEAAAIADTLGWLHYNRREYSAALALAKEAATELAGNAEVQYHLGMAAAMMGETETAKNALAAALKPGTGLAADFPGRAGIETRLSLLGDDEAANSIPASELEPLAAKDPNDPLLQMRLAAAFEREKNFPRAAATYEKALKQNSSLVAASISLARLNAGPLQNPAKALELVKNARKIASSDADAAVLGGIALEARDFEYAYTLLNQGVLGAKGDAGTMSNLAWAAYYLSKVKESRDVMQNLIKTAPQSPKAAEAVSFLALTTPPADAKALDEWSKAAEELLQTNPLHLPALMVRAEVEARKGEANKATATCEAILKQFPEFGPAMARLSAILAEDPQSREKAWELAGKALKLLPDDPELLQTSAILSYHRKDYPLAIRRMEAAARTIPLNASGLFYLGMSQWFAKDKTNASETLQKAIDAGLPAPLAEEAGRTLEAAKKP